MTRPVDFTLVTDGPSDRVLRHPIRWLLGSLGHNPGTDYWADFSTLKRKPRGLRQRIQAAARLYPSRLLFVHRDAEAEPWERRVDEIRRALEGRDLPAVCVVPVRMTEAWLLIDECALRHAAANPHGSVPLDLPAVGRLESLPSPKEVLHSLLVRATELSRGRLSRFNAAFAVQRLGELIEDYSPLRQLPAFRAFEEELAQMLERLE